MIPRPRGSFRRKLVLLTAAVTAAAMLLLTLLLQVILADLSRRDVSRILEERGDGVVSAVSSASTTDTLVVPDADLDADVLVYDSSGDRVAGTPDADLEDEYDDLGSSSASRVLDVGEKVRLRASPFTTDSGASGVVVVAERLAPFEAAEHYALLVSLVTGALATLAAAAVAAWVTGRALLPVAVLAATAEDWSEHDLDRRFDLGTPSDEITGLAATLDSLLDKVSAAIRAEQRLTSEVAHELRTPLTGVQGTADLVLMRDDLPPEAREDLAQIALEARRMAAAITTLLQVARTEAGASTAASCSLAAVVSEVVATAGSAVPVLVEVVDQRLAAPHATAVRALAPVVANAARHASTEVSIRAPGVTSGPVTITIEDDGDGVAGDPAWVFEPGATSGSGSGAGLGLSIARRMARSVGGEIEIARPSGPTRFVVRLPRA